MGGRLLFYLFIFEYTADHPIKITIAYAEVQAAQAPLLSECGLC